MHKTATACGSAWPARSAPARPRSSTRSASACATAIEIAVVTNDIYTKEDAQFLIRSGALAEDRIVGVETGGCPHTAIREDASINLDAVDDARPALPGPRPRDHRERRRQPGRHLQPRAGRPHPLRDRRGRRRQDPAQGRPRHHHARTCWSSTRPTSRPTSAPRWRSWTATPRKMRGDRPFVFTSISEGRRRGERRRLRDPAGPAGRLTPRGAALAVTFGPRPGTDSARPPRSRGSPSRSGWRASARAERPWRRSACPLGFARVPERRANCASDRPGARLMESRRGRDSVSIGAPRPLPGSEHSASPPTRRRSLPR